MKYNKKKYILFALFFLNSYSLSANQFFVKLDYKTVNVLKTETIEFNSDGTNINTGTLYFIFHEVCKKKVNVQYVEKLLENKYITLDGGDFKNPEYYNPQL